MIRPSKRSYLVGKEKKVLFPHKRKVTTRGERNMYTPFISREIRGNLRKREKDMGRGQPLHTTGEKQEPLRQGTTGKNYRFPPINEGKLMTNGIGRRKSEDSKGLRPDPSRPNKEKKKKKREIGRTAKGRRTREEEGKRTDCPIVIN